MASEGLRQLSTRLGAALLRSAMLGGSPPVLIDRYQVDALLGAGANGVVVAAFDRQLRRRVAIKLTPLADVSERMLDEARVLATLRRPRHIVQVLDAGSGALSLVDGNCEVAYVSMDLVDGETFRTRLASSPAHDSVVLVFAHMADGLAVAHANRIVHGDVKPENVIVGRDNDPMLVDFGCSTLLTPGRGTTERPDVWGTARYLAPEVRRGQVTCASDVFSLAVAMWEAVAGVHPFGEDALPQTNWFGRLAPLANEDEMPKPLRVLLRKALHPKPSRRPTARVMRDALMRYHATLVGRFARFVRRAAWSAAALTFVVMFVVVAVRALELCVRHEEQCAAVLKGNMWL